MRNMIAVHCWKRKSGAHSKTTKAMRRNDKVKFHREHMSLRPNG